VWVASKKRSWPPSALVLQWFCFQVAAYYAEDIQCTLMIAMMLRLEGNRADYAALPDTVKESIEIKFVSSYNDVFLAAFA
jgi:hypothetical protein